MHILKWRSAVVKVFDPYGESGAVLSANPVADVKYRPGIFRPGRRLLLANARNFPDAIPFPLRVDLFQMFPGWNGERRKVLFLRRVDAHF